MGIMYLFLKLRGSSLNFSWNILYNNGQGLRHVIGQNY